MVSQIVNKCFGPLLLIMVLCAMAARYVFFVMLRYERDMQPTEQCHVQGTNSSSRGPSGQHSWGRRGPCDTHRRICTACCRPQCCCITGVFARFGFLPFAGFFQHLIQEFSWFFVYSLHLLATKHGTLTTTSFSWSTNIVCIRYETIQAAWQDFHVVMLAVTETQPTDKSLSWRGKS